MKCSVCGAEMRNTVGGCYVCDNCHNSIDDGVFRYTKQDMKTRENELHEPMLSILPSGDVQLICKVCFNQMLVKGDCSLMRQIYPNYCPHCGARLREIQQ